MAFIRRRIDVQFTLGGGSSGQGSTGTVTVSGLRVDATIIKSGGSGMGAIQLRIYGLTPTLMQQLSTYGYPQNLATGNSATVFAGDDQSGMSIISEGTITSAAADYTQMPDVSFNVSCRQGYIHQIQPAAPTSINGAADVATLMSNLAQQMGYAFENNGVSVKLNYPYHWGPARVQADEIARAADIAWIIDKNKLAIWPKTGYRAGEPVMIAAGGTLVGYPTFIQYGMVVKALLDPSLEYGRQIQVQSSLEPANGLWTVVNMSYELQSEIPDGAWFMTIQAYKSNVVPGQ